jgi:hypothetical protein
MPENFVLLSPSEWVTTGTQLFAKTAQSVTLRSECRFRINTNDLTDLIIPASL